MPNAEVYKFLSKLHSLTFLNLVSDAQRCHAVSLMSALNKKKTLCKRVFLKISSGYFLIVSVGVAAGADGSVMLEGAGAVTGLLIIS